VHKVWNWQRMESGEPPTTKESTKTAAKVKDATLTATRDLAKMTTIINN